MSDARERILERLRANRPTAVDPPPVYRKSLGWDREQRVAAFTERMQAVRGEVHHLANGDWVGWLNQQLPSQGPQSALVGHSEVGDTFATGAADAFSVRRYADVIEVWKEELFNGIDFSITSARAGLAETGSLVLWPDADEPRLMSLVPPLHVAILRTGDLYENFADLLAAENWQTAMPTNALLISGPSKTADIEQTLAYGIHGPKRLITLLIG